MPEAGSAQRGGGVRFGVVIRFSPSRGPRPPLMYRGHNIQDTRRQVYEKGGACVESVSTLLIIYINRCNESSHGQCGEDF